MRLFPNTRYDAQWRLAIWQPKGTLEDTLLDQIIQFVESEEGSLDGPFNRFTDLSALYEIRLKIGHVFEIAAHRRDMLAGHEPVKSAIYANTTVGFGIARMYEHLLEGSPINVRPFRELIAAADWLGVPVEILREKPPTLSPSPDQAHTT
jgi:hypothetical protein